MKTTIIRIVMIIGVLFQVFSVCAQQKTSLRIHVKTSDNIAAPEVLLQISGIKETGVTDENGNFIFKNIPVKRIHLKALLVGYQSQDTALELQPQALNELNFNIQYSKDQLDEVIVASRRAKYNILPSEVVAKMPLTNLENPQVYSTISNKLIQDQLVFSVDDAMRNAPGVQKMWGATGRAGDGGSYYNSRGFTVQATMRNGIAGVVTDAIDVANLETLEIIKGPSGTLFGSTLTSYGGLINRITKKPYDHVGGNASLDVGGYGFGRGTFDINTPIDIRKKLLFRLNGAYNYEGTFQTVGFSKRYFFAPSLAYKPSDKLSFNLDAELSYGKNQQNAIIFFYFPSAQLGVDRADKVNIDYQNSYLGNGILQKSRSQNYFAQMNYTPSKQITSTTNFTYGKSFSNGRNPYFFLVPNAMINQNPTDFSNSNYLARADQSTTNGTSKITEIQQNFNGDFLIGNLRNRVVFGLDYTRIHSNILFFSNAQYFDIVPLNFPYSPAGYDYSGMNGVSLDNYYAKYFDSSNYVSKYPSQSITNTYSAYISDVLNITERLGASAAIRVDRFEVNNLGGGQNYKQTVFSPKFGLVYQILPNQISAFANYQNGFRNQNTYRAHSNGNPDSLLTIIAKPEQANQWEIGVKTDLIKNKLSGSLSYYNINVKNILRADPNDPANAQVQDGAQISRGVELQLSANPFTGFNIISGLTYNSSKYDKADNSVNGLRPTTAGSPWQSNLWLSYKFSDDILKGLRIGFGGNYANDNKIVNNIINGSNNTFTLPSYIVLNTSVVYEAKDVIIGFKIDNLTNKHYWTGYTTMNPQMLRQFVASITYRF